MQFGTKLKDANTASSAGGSGKWIKNFKTGDTKLRFLQETDDWVVYWEHYNPMGTAFPCTGDKTSCPGCTSDNERMKHASRKTAVNVLIGQYVDVYKLTTKLVNRLITRAERNNNTITDREYTITRMGEGLDTEYDVESGAVVPIDLAAYELNDIPAMLKAQFEENFPDFREPAALKSPTPGVHAGDLMDAVARAKAQQAVEQPAQQSVEPPAAEQPPMHADGKVYGTEVPPSEPAAQNDAGEQESSEQEVTIEQLKMMTPDQLKTLCASSGAPVPEELTTQAEIIGWMEKQFA